jgi:hypothetical protein
VTGTERLAWTQPGDASTLRFRAYVDGNPVDLGSASCAASSGPECSSPLPPMANGVHTIALAAVSSSGAESPRSDAMTVEKVSAAGSTALTAESLPDASANVAVRFETILTGPDGQAFAADVIGRSLKAPLQMAALPDGRLLVADGDGRVSVMFPDAPDRDGLAMDSRALLDAAATGPVGLAAHPDFASNHIVYASIVAPERSGARLRIVRLREVNGLLGEPATVFEAPLTTGAPVSGATAMGGDWQSLDPAMASAPLAFGPDGLLYAVLSPGVEFYREPAASTPLASIVRIDGEGRASSAGALDGIGAHPLGLAWHPATSEMLAIFPAADGSAAIASVDRGAVSGVSATGALAADVRVVDRPSLGTLRFDPADTRALPLGRAFVGGLNEGRPAAVRLTVPVALDGMLGSLSGELIDVVASGGTVYAAVTASGTPGADNRVGLVVRLRPR